MVKQRADIDPTYFQTFGDLLRYLRERARLSQRELAQQVGYHYSYLSRLEKNVRTPDEIVLRTRFIPALRIEREPVWAERLLELASEPPPDESASKEAEHAQRPRWEANWPANLTPLLGRESESQALFQILLSEEVRLVTIIGPPGVGKTRLSQHVAEQLAPHFKDGAVFVDLMPIFESEQVMPALATALGTQETGEASVVASIKSALHARDVLIVMDNFEQVLSAAPELLPLLAAAPGLKILTTSREALRLRGEQEFPLVPLAVPNAENPSVMDFPSVQLFLQRARAAKPDLQLDESDALRVAEICRRLDGLPLAIELAAARIRTFSPSTMLEQFDRRFQWLAQTGRDIPEWRRTLWSAIAWSYNLLSENERILFERLAVFAGGWTIEAAEAVCCDDQTCPRGEILNMLLQMVDKSLMVIEAGGRYRFLDTIAKFAHEKLIERGGLEETSNRHLHYFAEWAEALDARFNSMTPLEFQERTGVELNNIRAALDWALHHPAAFFDGLRLSIPANLIWLEHGQVRDEYERAQAFLRAADTPATRILQGRLLLRTAALGRRIGQDMLAYEYGTKAKQIAIEHNDQKLLAAALLMLGDLERDSGRFEAAESSLKECVALYRQFSMQPELSQSLTAIGNNLFHQGRRNEAGAALQEALDIATRINDVTGQGAALRVSAGILRYEGKYAEALESFQRALELARANGDRPNAGIHLVNISILLNMMGDFQASERCALESLAVFRSLGDEDQQAFPKRMAAYGLLHQGFPTRAHTFAMESLRANLNGGTGVLACLTALAEIKLTEGKLEPIAKLYGFIKPRVTEKFAVPSPDSLAFERIGRALENADTDAWQAAGASMLMEEAVALASQWTPSWSSKSKRRSTRRISQKKQSRH